MNADVCWEGDVLTPLLNYLQENPDVGMVMPKTFYPDGDLQYTCRMLANAIRPLCQTFSPRIPHKKRMERYLLPHNHDIAINCPYLLGSFLLFRNDALRQCGVFDECFSCTPKTSTSHAAFMSIGERCTDRSQHNTRTCGGIPQKLPYAPHTPRQHDHIFQQMGMAMRQKEAAFITGASLTVFPTSLHPPAHQHAANGLSGVPPPLLESSLPALYGLHYQIPSCLCR